MAKPRRLRLWAQGDAHVGRDLEFGRTSLSDALSQSEKGAAILAGPLSSGISRSMSGIIAAIATCRATRKGPKSSTSSAFWKHTGASRFTPYRVITTVMAFTSRTANGFRSG